MFVPMLGKEYIVATVSRATNLTTLYVDGAPVDAMAYAPTYSDTYDYYIGVGNDSYWPGSIDGAKTRLAARCGWSSGHAHSRT